MINTRLRTRHVDYPDALDQDWSTSRHLPHERLICTTRPSGGERTRGSAGRVFPRSSDPPPPVPSIAPGLPKGQHVYDGPAVLPTNAAPLPRSVPSSSLTAMSDMVVSTSPTTVKAAYACQVCHRAYERLDHLNRHLDSRNNNLSNCKLDLQLMDYRPQREIIQMLRVS
jgi:hypothetical protein